MSVVSHFTAFKASSLTRELLFPTNHCQFWKSFKNACYRMLSRPGSLSFRLPASHLRHRCKDQHPWFFGKIRFLMRCRNAGFDRRPWINSRSYIILVDPANSQPPIHTYSYCIFARIHKFQLAWISTYLLSKSKEKVCVQASLSLVHAL